MRSASAARLVPDLEITEDRDVTAARNASEVEGFLAAFAIVLRETIVRFEHTAGRISEMVTAKPGASGRELVMTLQQFDRLQQEFTALGDVMDRFAGCAEPGAPDSERIHGAISGISMTEVKDRFALQLKPASSHEEPGHFQDVEF